MKGDPWTACKPFTPPPCTPNFCPIIPHSSPISPHFPIFSLFRNSVLARFQTWEFLGLDNGAGRVRTQVV